MDDERINKLEENLSALRKDFAEIGQTLRDIASVRGQKAAEHARHAYDEMSDHTQDFLEDVQEHGQQYYDQAREYLDETLNFASRKIRQKPLQTIAVVAGIGFIIGFLANRR